MASQEVIDPRHLGAVWISEQSAIATVGTERRCFPVTDSVEPDLQQAELERGQLSSKAWDRGKPVKGYKSGTCAVRFYLQPTTTVLDDAATPDTDANAPLRIPLRCLMGGESVAAGSTIAAGTHSTTGFSVATGHGARFPAGQLVLVDQSGGGTEDLVPCRVLSRSTDALTVWPALANIPAGGAGERVINSHTFYPTAVNTKSMSLALAAAQGTGLQWRLLGGTGTFEITFQRGALLEMGLDLTFATHQGPDDLSLTVTTATDPMSEPLSTRSARLYLQPQGTTTRVCFHVDSFTLRANTGMQHIESLTCGTEGFSGVARVESLAEHFAEIEVTFAVDTDFDDTYWADRTELAAMLFVSRDDTTARRGTIIDAPRVIVVGKPRVAPAANNLSRMTVTLRAMRDDTTSGTFDVTELAEAPLRIGLV